MEMTARLTPAQLVDRIVAHTAQLQIVTDELAAALAVAPSAPDADLRELVEQLRAYGEDESNNARIGKDREAYQFYQGWCAALDRITPLAVRPPVAAGIVDHGFASHPLGMKCSICDAPSVPASPPTLDIHALVEALEFAKGAIRDAICLEDGLDGLAGERVIQMIDRAIYKGGK
jgi:hypothetical protein